MAKNGRELSPAETRQRGESNLRHGARSSAQIRPVARAQKRRFLRQAGMRASDLDPIGQGYLEAWARCAAKVELLDRWIAQHGLLDDAGEMPGFMTLYVSLVNSCRLSLAKLEERIEQRVEPDPFAAIESVGRTIREDAGR